ncbi:putative disease resistance RPP13-like protein 1 isoform X1, partial [Tanacetum coccineum]
MPDMVHDVACELMGNERLMVTGTHNKVDQNHELRSGRHYSTHDCPQKVLVPHDCVTLPHEYFHRFTYLKTLDLSQPGGYASQDDMEAEFGNIEHIAIDVIDILHLNTNLATSQIDKYGGQWFSSWMVSLTNLKNLQLQKWANYTCFPPLGKLPLHKELHIE